MRTTANGIGCPRRSPWGDVQHVEKLANGIFSVSTSSHGGIYVAPGVRLRIPEPWRQTPYSGGGWFEEDSDWVIPFYFLRDLLYPMASAATRNAYDSGYIETAWRQHYQHDGGPTT